MSEAQGPAALDAHAAKYGPGAYRAYSLDELGAWVHLLHKRAGHRLLAEDRAKDLRDARNYWLMMGETLDAAVAE